MVNRIVEVLYVEDTREFIEDGDRWIALSGSGDIRQCDRCGRDHEVHVTVKLEDGNHAIVGLTCMNADGMEFVKDARRLASRAATIRRNEAALVKARQQLQEAEAWAAEVERMTAPEIFTVEANPQAGKTYICGDARLCCWNDQTEAEIREEIVKVWRRRRTEEKFRRPIWLLLDDVKGLEFRIAKARKANKPTPVIAPAGNERMRQ